MTLHASTSTGNHVYDMWLGEQEAKANQPEAEEPDPVTCRHCSGTGMAGTDPEDVCDDCNGEGVRYV